MRRTVLHRRAVVLVLLGLVLATATATTTSLLPHPGVPDTAAPRTSDVLANLPISFVPSGDGFVSRGPGYSLALTGAQATVDVGDGTFQLRPAGPLADPAAIVAGARPLGGTVSHLTGDDPARWQAGLPTFARVEVSQVWPGVDMIWHGDQRRLQHDMVVAPGVDPSVVAFDVEGARALDLQPGGDLVLDLGGAGGAVQPGRHSGGAVQPGRHSGGAVARLARPVAYQDVAGHRRQVPAEFRLLGPSSIGFTVGAYDPGVPLVIDPTLVTSTVLGGAGSDSGYAVATDPQGNTYVIGSTESADFPTTAPLQGMSTSGGAPTSDVFVSKFSPDGNRLEWSTYLGGTGRDIGYSLAVASDGSVYVGGVTESADFPRIPAEQRAYGGGTSDAFIARIAANGRGLEWSTPVGGTQTDRGRGVAVDSAGNGYLVGSTNSTDFPSVNPQQAGPFRDGDLDAFLVKVPFNGTPITYATRLGGGNDDRGLAVAVDLQSNAYVTGDTLSPGFPTVRPLQPTFGGSAGGAGTFTDAFLAKYNPTGSALVYSTFIGGSDVDQGTAVAVDSQGAAYVTGNTNSSNFPTVGPLQAIKANDLDAFVTKVDPPGGALVYSTFYGGTGPDGANAITVDRTGSAHVVGTTGSANLATAKPLQGAKGGGDDAFLLRLDSTGRGPLFASFLGGREAEAAMGVALGPRGVMHVVGLTASADFTSLRPVQGARPPAAGDAFVSIVDPADAAAPAPEVTVAAPAPATTSTTSAHDRRVWILAGLTIALLLAAVLQTMFLRRRVPATTTARPRPKPATRPTAPPGLKTLEQAGSGPAKAGTATKAAAVPKSTRAPKTRGGPKGAAAKKAGAKKSAGQKTGNRRATPATGPVPVGVPDGPAAPLKGPAADAEAPGDPGAVIDASKAEGAVDADVREAGAGDVREAGAGDVPGAGVAVDADVAGAGAVADPVAEAQPTHAPMADGDTIEDGGPRTVAAPTPMPPKRVRPQEPAIAQLLEEDLFSGEPAAVSEDSRLTGEEAEPEEQDSAPEWAPFDTGSTPVIGATAPSEAPPAIPPVPAEELSFWDLFPEDLPPARATSFPAEDLLAPDRLALPEGPERAVGRLVGPSPDDPGAAPAPATEPDELEEDLDRRPARPPHPPEAEIVIAELLERPPPSGPRPSAESIWAPQPMDDFVLSDLLPDEPGNTPLPGPPPPPEADEPDGRGDDGLPAPSGPRPGEQARIAADRARRRRSRRRGGGRPLGSG